MRAVIQQFTKRCWHQRRSNLAEATDLLRMTKPRDERNQIVTEQRSAAAESVRSCRYPRLREVLEFLLDLAVPEQAVEAARQPLTSPDR
ncbi:MAG: hypothetical protein EBZ13_02800 [Planctomycetia bacterium]|nr:hypothetical protein [Planctomycetia bacterium]